MPFVEPLVRLVQPWASLYADHQNLATSVIAAHVLSMFVGGGVAIAADRAILRAAPGTADAVRAIIADLSSTHTAVITALTISVISGAALMAADVPTFSVSAVYWSKMGTLVLLVLNGLRLRRAERSVMVTLDGAPVHTAEMPLPFPVAPWRRVRSAAAASLGLWMVVVLLGVLLSNG